MLANPFRNPCGPRRLTAIQHLKNQFLIPSYLYRKCLMMGFKIELYTKINE